MEDSLTTYRHLITNFFAVALANILKSFNVYPDECFEVKTVVNLLTISVKPSILLDYIQSLQDQISHLYPYLTGIQIILLTQQSEVVHTLTIHINQDIAFLTHSKRITTYQRDMALKSMIYSLQKSLSPAKKAHTFDVKLLTNGHETQMEELQRTLMDNWVAIPTQKVGGEKLIDSVHWPGFDLLVD